MDSSMPWKEKRKEQMITFGLIGALWAACHWEVSPGKAAALECDQVERARVVLTVKWRILGGKKELSTEVAGIRFQNAFENVHFSLLVLLAGRK